MKGWIADFLHHLLAQKGCSKRTEENYRKSLNNCVAFFSGRLGLREWTAVETQHVRQWVADMMDNGYAPATVNCALSALRSFYKYLLREGRVEVDPARLVKNPKMPKRLPTFIKESEMDRLFAFYPFGEDYLGRRNYTILLLLYHTGLRASELLGLNVYDIDLAAHQLKVTGKGDKQRIVPFGDELAEALRAYFQLRLVHLQSVKSAAQEAVWLTQRGMRMSYEELREMVNTCLSSVTTQQKRSPHVLRHSFATAMLANGAQLEAIQQLLGHESVATTAIYTHTTLAELKAEYAQAHPRKGKK